MRRRNSASTRITSYNVCYTKLLRQAGRVGNFKQGTRIVVIGQRDDVLTIGFRPGNAAVDSFRVGKIEQQVGLGVADDTADGRPFGRKDGVR